MVSAIQKHESNPCDEALRNFRELEFKLVLSIKQYALKNRNRLLKIP